MSTNVLVVTTELQATSSNLDTNKRNGRLTLVTVSTFGTLLRLQSGPTSGPPHCCPEPACHCLAPLDLAFYPQKHATSSFANVNYLVYLITAERLPTAYSPSLDRTVWLLKVVFHHRLSAPLPRTKGLSSYKSSLS